MVVLLYEPRLKAAADSIAAALRAAFSGIAVGLLESTAPGSWPDEKSWDDILVVPFDEHPLDIRGAEFVAAQLSRKLFVLPVAVTPHRVPPLPLANIKAVPFEGGYLDRVCARLSAMLGLRLRRRDHTIFISYREVDGRKLAEQLEVFLAERGYNVWRDDSKDMMDGQTMIPPGTDVQLVIEANLRKADLILVLDTPRAAESGWIKLEIDTANGDLIPVLPIFIKLLGDNRLRCSRFKALETLQRACVIAEKDAVLPEAFSQTELDSILSEMESYLRELFERRLRMPFQVKEEFVSQQYRWNERDHFIYEAVRERGAMLRTRVYSHCSIYDGIFEPALRAFVQHLEAVTPPANYAFYVYDGTLIPVVQLEDIEQAATLDRSSNVLLLHHQEVRAVLQSNFTSRS